MCLAVSRREGGNCIAGIDIDSGKWIRPVNAKTHGALGDHEIVVKDGGTQKLRILKPLDVLQLRLDKYAGDKVQPENWELAPASSAEAFTVLRRFDGREDAVILTSYLDQGGPLLHTYSNRISADDPLLMRRLRHSLSIIRPQQLHWKIEPHAIYRNKLRIEADFRFDEYPYCLVLTDPIWEARCGRLGQGRHPHSTIAEEARGQILLTISLAGVPFNGYYYKLAAGVVNLPT
jgi:hypothetical protein